MKLTLISKYNISFMLTFLGNLQAARFLFIAIGIANSYLHLPNASIKSKEIIAKIYLYVLLQFFLTVHYALCLKLFIEVSKVYLLSTTIFLFMDIYFFL